MTPQIFYRHSIRLQGYDYSLPGAYFVTFNIQNREYLLGEIIGDKVRLNEFGNIVKNVWIENARRNPELEINEFIVMPDHFHGILIIKDNSNHNSDSPGPIWQRRKMVLSKTIGRVKMLSAKEINEKRGTPGMKVWQRNYYEHIIRDEDEMNNIRRYILENLNNLS